MTKKVLLCSFISLVLLSSAYAQEDFEADLGGFETEEVSQNDDLDGFDSLESSSETQEVVAQDESPISVSGAVAFKTSFGYKKHILDGVDYSGFNQAQSSLYLQIDTKMSEKWKVRISGDAFYDAIYDLRDQPYNNDVLDTYKTQLRLDDTYVQGQLSKYLDLKVGRQVVVWGKSDSIRVTDVINPLDNRNPGMTDIEDLRLPTTMAKLDYYLGEWNFSAMLIGESRIFLEAAPRGEFFPVDKVFPGAPRPFFDLVQPSTSWDNLQYAFAANGVFSGWDLSFYAADVLDSKWHLEGSTPQSAKRVVSKIKMLGSALNVASGSWLFKGEVAFVSGVRYNSTADEKSRFDTLLGFDYMGISDTLLSAEFVNRHIFDYEEQMGITTPTVGFKPDYVDKNEYQTALRATRSFMNDTLNVTALLSMFGATWEYGGFARVWVEYKVMDAVSANVGFVDYLDGDKPFAGAISDNDRIFADISYSF